MKNSLTLFLKLVRMKSKKYEFMPVENHQKDLVDEVV